MEVFSIINIKWRFWKLISYKMQKSFRSRRNVLSIGQSDIHSLVWLQGKMHYPVLPEIAVDKVANTDPKTCLYHGIGCVDIHSRKLGIGGNVTTGENTGIVYVLKTPQKWGFVYSLNT